MERLFLIAALTAPIAATAAGVNSEKYCEAVAKLASGYVEDRDALQPYGTTLYTIDAAVAQADLSAAEKSKYRQDMRASAKIAYVDFPEITQEGIAKLVYLGCKSE